MKRVVLRQFTAMALTLGLLLGLLPASAASEPGTQQGRATGDVTSGLAGYWSFDGDTQEARLANQAAGSPITAEVSGSGAETQAEGGIHAGSVYFSAQANSPLKLNLTEAGQGLNAAAADFTLAAWVNYDSDMDSSQRVDLFQLTDGGRTILYVNPNGTYGTYLTGNDVAMSTTAPVGGRWHHVVLTWEYASKTMTCYINGSQEVRTDLSGNPVSEATDILIGAHKSGAVGQAIKGHVDELRCYTRALTADDVTELYQYGGYNEIAEQASQPRITVDTETVVREITPAMFGINHRYHKNGYGTWDNTAKKVNEDFNAMVEEGGFGSIRWPGGTVSNLFTWKDSIGPLENRTPTIAGNNFYSDAGEAPVEPGFGLDEAAAWIRDDLGVEMIYVYGMGRGSAQDAADLVEYLNAPNDSSNPGGGTDWAAVRAANGHPDPYGVTKFEIGNEFTDVGQNYWATPRGTDSNQAVEDYIMGGRRDFAGETQYCQHNDRVVKKGDWRKAASFSDGLANEERYLCYVPVVEESATIYVNGAEWQIVNTLEGQAADAEVCTLDYETGKITFGDGTNGKIPPQGQQITAHYSSDRDGFVAYYNAMQAIADEIDGLEIKIYSGVHDALQSSFITKMHEKGYDDKYDGVIYHPYTNTSYNESSYDNALTQARAQAAQVGSLKSKMDSTSGHTDKEVAVSEFGINRTDEFTKSLGNALYTANHMIDCVNQGAAYQNRHCLVDFTQGDNLGAWTQCVIQCLGSPASEVSTNEFISTPSAQAFSIFNNMTGGTQIAYAATGNDNYATGNGQTVQKLNIYTTKDAEGNVYVLVVNNQKSVDQAVHISLKDEDLTGREIKVWSLASDSVMDQNTQAEPDKVTVRKTQVTADAETLSYTLPAHSISSFKIPAPTPPAPNVVSVAPLTAGGAVGTAFNDLALPATVTATLSNGTTADLGVVWSSVGYDASVTTAQTITGALTLPNDGSITNTNDVTATLTLTLTPVPTVVRVQFTPASLSVANGTAFADLGLPTQGTATLTDDSTVEGAIIWAEEDYNATQAGVQTIHGTFTGGGKTASVTIQVTVADPVIKHAVTFRSEGSDDTTVEVVHGQAIGTLPTPATRTGYTFEGWFYGEPETRLTEEYVVNGDLTVTAKWAANSSQGGPIGGGFVTLPSTTTTTTNPDGTTTTTVTDNRTGTVTETTGKADGSVEVVETKRDGTVTETVTDKDGAKVETVTDPDKNVAITVTDKDGEVLAEVKLPAEMPKLPEEEKFVDVPDDNWAAEAINSMAALGVIQGKGGQIFDRSSPMKRSELAEVLYKMSNGKPGIASGFTDVAEGEWYADSVAWAAAAGVVNGVGENSFAPDLTITREELAAMLARYAKLLGLDTSADRAELDAFGDKASTHDWAADAMAWCVKAGIIQGKGGSQLDPRTPASRAEVAVMLQRFVELMK